MGALPSEVAGRGVIAGLSSRPAMAARSECSAGRTMRPAHGHASAQPCRLGIEYGGDGFDLNELVVVTKHGDAHQGARYVVVTE